MVIRKLNSIAYSFNILNDTGNCLILFYKFHFASKYEYLQTINFFLNFT